MAGKPTKKSAKSSRALRVPLKVTFDKESRDTTVGRMAQGTDVYFKHNTVVVTVACRKAKNKTAKKR